jgi:excisionase family DNA binding protein
MSALTVRDVAHELSVSEQGVRNLLKRGHLRGYQVGRRWRVDPEQLRAFIDAQSAARADATRPAPGAPDPRWGDLEPIENPFD